jgi:outer membrane protein assembly factor BamD
MSRNRLFVITVGVLAFFLLSGFGLFGKKKKVDTPAISKDTLQPDKILFDRALHDIDHGNYEEARLTLNTLINTYDTSEYLAKAKLAIADSWYREGGSHGYAEAEQEYKDFQLFYPNMEEAAESQYKVCDIHYRQMEKSDRDSAQAQHAEDECRAMEQQYPNSKYTPKAEQMLRETQEVIADKEYKTGDFYHTKGSYPAAANRMKFVAQQYPLYSGADDALWELADSYKHMGDRFEDDEVDALTRIVRDYPLSEHVQQAKDMLLAMKRPVPEADPKAYARMKYDLDNYRKPGIFSRTVEIFSGRPDVSLAAKTGTPAMESIRPPVPVSVPASAAGTLGAPAGVSDVSISANADASAIDKQPDARLVQPAPPQGSPSTGVGEQKASVGSNGQSAAQTQETPTQNQNVNVQSLPTNHPLTAAQMKQQLKQLKKQQEAALKYMKKHPAAAAAAQAAANGQATTTAQPAAGTTPARPAASSPQ